MSYENTEYVDTVLFKTEAAAGEADMETEEMMQVDGSSQINSSSEKESKEHALPSKKPPAPKMDLKRNLRILISNMYMKSENRLPGACVPKCLRNSSECEVKHRTGMMPDLPDFMAQEDLKRMLRGHHYDTFLEMLEMMAMQGVYPGDTILDSLIEMAMVLIAKELVDIYDRMIRTFFLLVNAFPPCWTCLRPYYLNFLRIPKPTIRSRRTGNGLQTVKFYVDLLEEILPQCSDKEIREPKKFYEKYVFNFTDEEQLNLSMETALLGHVQNYNWGSGKLCLDDFNNMSPSARLSRLCDVLNMVCSVLEMEFLSWLDHNRLRQSEAEMFNEDTKPFAIHVFGMSATERLTDIVRQVMRLYGLAAGKSMYPDRLKILQRLISLVVEVSNTAELKYLDNAVTYPNLGPQTRLLIAQFFKIFKSQNPKHISTYIKTIPLLGQPYLRFEFTDHFLQLFYFPRKVAFGPKKVCDEFSDRQWVKYKPRNEIEDNDEEQLSREDYLNLLLNALKDYDKWMNLEGFWKMFQGKEQVQQLQTRINKPMPTPLEIFTGQTFKVVNVPEAKINLTELSVRYNNDVRSIRCLRRVLVKKVKPEIDVSDWLDYLNGFLCDNEPPSPPASPRSSPASDPEEG